MNNFYGFRFSFVILYIKVEVEFTLNTYGHVISISFYKYSDKYFDLKPFFLCADVEFLLGRKYSVFHFIHFLIH